MRLLVLGTGLVGRYLVRDALRRGWETFYGHRGPTPPADLFAPLPDGAGDDAIGLPVDVTKAPELESIVEKARPDLVVHAAALADVEQCERDRVKAQSVNVWATRSLARVAAAKRVPLLYVSTAYVFDGRRGHYKEGDPPNPQNFFGLTKLEGERAVAAQPGLESLTVRACTMVGMHPTKRNVATALHTELANRRPVQVAQDQWDGPAYAGTLAEATLSLWDAGERGLVHLAGGERTSRYGLAKGIAEVFGHDSALIRPVSMAELRLGARRPPDSSLLTQKAQRVIGFEGATVRTGLRALKEEMAQRPASLADSAVARP